MIGRLRGRLLEKNPPLLLLDVAGVGYEVQAPMSTFYRLPEINKELSLHTHFIVREDAQLLFGFFQEEERTLFRTLIKVNGVGPKLALAILSGMETNTFIQCIHQQDAKSLLKLPGVGKKMAERLVVEMSDWANKWQSTIPIINATQSSTDDAQSALEALGYNQKQAEKAVAPFKNKGMDSEQIIRQALRGM